MSPTLRKRLWDLTSGIAWQVVGLGVVRDMGHVTVGLALWLVGVVFFFRAVLGPYPRKAEPGE